MSSLKRAEVGMAPCRARFFWLIEIKRARRAMGRGGCGKRRAIGSGRGRGAGTGRRDEAVMDVLRATTAAEAQAVGVGRDAAVRCLVEP